MRNCLLYTSDAADEQRRVGRLAFAYQALDRRQAGGLREQAELFEGAVEMRKPEIDADENDGAILAGDVFRQAEWGLAEKSAAGGPAARCAGQAAASSFSAAEKLTARPGTMVEMACL